MIENTKNTIAINPGTRHMGIVLFRGTDLRDWRLKSYKGKWSKKKKEKILQDLFRLIEEHDVGQLVLKKLHLSRSSKGLQELERDIRTKAGRKRLGIARMTIQEVEENLGEEKLRNRKELAAAVMREYPFLFARCGDKAERTACQLRLIETVALGLASIINEDNKHHHE